ncbi:MAG: TetR-like C-terminal domain-containing protein [bacterium]|nr:TetR-like C-terminal domain-containing protein [bacterium]
MTSPTSTESVRDDLYRRFDFSERPDHQVLDGIATVALAADLWQSSPDLLEKWRRDYPAPQRRSLRRDLQPAVASGLIPADADFDLIMDAWAGTLVFLSLLTGTPTDPAGGRRLIDATLEGPPRLET